MFLNAVWGIALVGATARFPQWKNTGGASGTRRSCYTAAMKTAEPRLSLYSVPRRFDLATVLVVTAAYSLLLGSLTAAKAHPLLTTAVAGFVTLVGSGQALLFGGLKPRLASIVVGISLFELMVIVAYFVNSPAMGSFIWLFIVINAAYGLILGYVVGTVVGGVFLVADAIRRRDWRLIFRMLLIAATLFAVGLGVVMWAIHEMR